MISTVDRLGTIIDAIDQCSMLAASYTIVSDLGWGSELWPSTTSIIIKQLLFSLIYGNDIHSFFYCTSYL